MKTAKKITMATVKSFIRKNRYALRISSRTQFDGMCDGIMPTADQSFVRAYETDTHMDATLGVQGAWFTNSKNYLQRFEEAGMIGFRIQNCCGSFDLAVETRLLVK